jgi:hypothetical protein
VVREGCDNQQHRRCEEQTIRHDQTRISFMTSKKHTQFYCMFHPLTATLGWVVPSSALR